MPIDKVATLPFYGYTIEDPEGNVIDRFTKVVFKIEPHKVPCGKLTVYTEEQIIKDVDAEIAVRQPEETGS
jgi:hypothetical protein